MGKRIKAFSVIALIAAMMFGTVQVSAAGFGDAGQTVDGSLLTTETSVEDSKSVLTRGNILSDGTMQLSNMGNRTVCLSGLTVCHMVCDQVICNLYLEQLSDEGIWNNYDYWNYSTTNAYSLSETKNVKVPGGHWYRARGGHIAIKDKMVESITTATDGIWIE